MLSIQDPSRLRDMGKNQLLSHGMFGFGFKHTKLGISSFQKCEFYCVSVPHSGPFSHFYRVKHIHHME